MTNKTKTNKIVSETERPTDGYGNRYLRLVNESIDGFRGRQFGRFAAEVDDVFEWDAGDEEKHGSGEGLVEAGRRRRSATEEGSVYRAKWSWIIAAAIVTEMIGVYSQKVAAIFSEIDDLVDWEVAEFCRDDRLHGLRGPPLNIRYLAHIGPLNNFLWRSVTDRFLKILGGIEQFKETSRPD